MKKTLLSLFLAFVLVFSCTTVGFAALPDEEVAQPYATSSIGIGVDRVSATKANASVDVNFATYVDSFTITVYLQKLSNNSWVNDTDNEDYVTRVTGSNKADYCFDKVYDKLTRGTSYRLKVVSKTTVGTVSYTGSAYSATF